MSEFQLTSIEEFEAATERLLETGSKVGADSWQLRVKNQTPHCKFGEQAGSVLWDPAGLQKKLPEVSADATPTELPEETSCVL